MQKAEMRAAQEVLLQGKTSEVSQDLSTARSASEERDLRLVVIPLKAGNRVMGVLCLRNAGQARWLMSKQRVLEEQGPFTDQATFFWTFLDEAIMKIERAHLLSRNRADN